ncbi:MAG: hypothetical protein LC772_11300 [Chloroflexi bacterium]|nr:hypothetical protein [Chloroflexota bacterium]
MTWTGPDAARRATPLVLVVTGLVACAVAERLGYRDLVTIAVATNAAGLALLTQHRAQAGSTDEGSNAEAE